jgi:Protein phosphatase 2C
MTAATKTSADAATASAGTATQETRTAAAAVTGAAHLRVARNGQDSVARWSQGKRGVVVVCDGCGSGASSELGAIFTARALCAAMARRLAAGEPATERATWEAARGEVVHALTRLVASWAPEDGAVAQLVPQLVEQHLLCTAVAAACDERGASVWAVGDGAYVLDGELTVLGPFAENAPPYLAYELLGVAPRAHFAARRHGADDANVACRARGAILVATDGAAALGEDLCAFAAPETLEHLLTHPDALRRHLATLARPAERIVWSERRVERTAAALQDDAAIALLSWRRS